MPHTHNKLLHTGKALCQNIVTSLSDSGLEIQLCRSQTMHGVGNIAGRGAVYAALSTKESARIVYH